MGDNENIKDIVDIISDMILEYINEEKIKENSNKNTS